MTTIYCFAEPFFELDDGGYYHSTDAVTNVRVFANAEHRDLQARRWERDNLRAEIEGGGLGAYISEDETFSVTFRALVCATPEDAECLRYGPYRKGIPDETLDEVLETLTQLRAKVWETVLE